jgi:hypothetical protein
MVSIFIAVITVSQVPDVKPGRRLAVVAPGESWVPAAASRDAYRKYILAVRNGDKKEIEAMYPESLKVIKGGSRIEVIAVDRLNIKRDYIADPSPGSVPAVVLKISDNQPTEKEEQLFVPMIYFEDAGNPSPVSAKFPLIDIVVDDKAVPDAGMKMLVFLKGKTTIPIAKDLFAFEAMIKAGNANDDVGIKELALARRIVGIDIFTPILVIERHTNPFLAQGVHAVEARILGGPYKEQACWVEESCVIKLALKVVPREAPTKKRAGAKGRR